MSTELPYEPVRAVFTIRVRWDGSTQTRTEADTLANPAECLRGAIKALEHELSRVERCPRMQALHREAEHG